MSREFTRLLLPLLISCSFILSYILRLPQYLTKFKTTDRIPVLLKDPQNQDLAAIENVETTYKTTLEAPKVNHPVRDQLPKAHYAGVKQTTASRPPLDSLIADARFKYIKGRNQTIIGDPQFLLDFAIVGFPKTGSTSLSFWMSEHPETQIANDEIWEFAYGEPATAIWYLYTQLPEGDYKRGYKSPFDIVNKGDAMDSIRTFFPNTKLIVGVRHPIRWFESFFNFRVKRGVKLPQPNHLIKSCRLYFCVKTANFHVYLARLGKTDMTAPEELEMKRKFIALLGELPPPMHNKVFLYDMEQLADRNKTRMETFHRDVHDYIGLREEMPPIVHKNEGQANLTANERFIDICNPKYNRLRGELMKAARGASVWIRKYFLGSDDVFVSSRDYFEEILASWMHDPCENEKITQNEPSTVAKITHELSNGTPVSPLMNSRAATNKTLKDAVTNKTHDAIAMNATPKVAAMIKTRSASAPNKTVARRPPLSSLILDYEKNVVGDPQFLLDFAIIGFPKTGSTSVSRWIGLHPETLIRKNEMFALSEGKPARAVWSFYTLPQGDYKRGYKSPYDITNKGGALESLRKYWPMTRLIIGVRHPVRWFESFYNHRLLNDANPGDPYSLIDTCLSGLCVKEANFHVFLATLGKTNATALQDLGVDYPLSLSPPTMPNEVFIYDMEQLADRNKTRISRFGRDIQEYVGLNEEMPPIVHENEGKLKPAAQAYMDICDSKYDSLRVELMKASKRASLWIRKYFLDGDSVYFSSREYLEEILETWMYDPCDSLNATQRK